MKRFLIILFLSISVSAQLLPSDKPMFGMQLDLTSFSTRRLVFWSPFTKAGNLPDFSFDGNDGTITGATWQGSGLLFTGGSTDRVTLSKKSLDGAAAFTVIVVCTPEVLGADRGLFFTELIGTSFAINFWLDHIGGNITTAYAVRTTSENEGVTFGTMPITVGNKYHFALTYDGAFNRVYVNGQLDGTPAVKTGTLIASGTNYTIGNNNGQNRSFSGIISDTKLYTRALSAKEIQALFINPNLPIQVDPIWMFFQEAPAGGGQVIFITQ